MSSGNLGPGKDGERVIRRYRPSKPRRWEEKESKNTKRSTAGESDDLKQTSATVVGTNSRGPNEERNVDHFQEVSRYSTREMSGMVGATTSC